MKIGRPKKSEMQKKSLDLEVFKKLVSLGFNCKQIAEKMGWHNHSFGIKMKDILGIYPSVYISRIKNGKTENSST